MSTLSKSQQLFETLSPEAQREFIDTELWSLLNSEACRDKLDSTITRLHKKYLSVPLLDLRAKKKEIRPMLVDIRRDAKRSAIHGTSNRNEILEEIVASLTQWLSEIWQAVYEHKTCFDQAHACLIYVWEVLEELLDMPGIEGCRCTVMNWPFDASIKDKRGKTIKRFTNVTLRYSEKVVLWLWRELLVSLSATQGACAKKRISSFILDIEECLGVSALERLLYGGRRDEEDEEDEDRDSNWTDTDGSEDGEEEDEDENSSKNDEDREADYNHCRYRWYASHWSPTINRHRVYVRDAVLERLRDVFEISPSLNLHRAIMSISPDTAKTTRELSETLVRVAGHSSANFAAALTIFGIVGDSNAIVPLLDNHSHLLRAHDASSYQCAVLALSDVPKYQARALKILETELQETTHSMFIAIKSCFNKVDEPSRKAELLRIIKMQYGSQQRKNRIENWVDSVVTSTSTPLNPMAFFGFMLGIPTGNIEEEEEAEYIEFLQSLDSDDEEHQTIKDEYEPHLKERFEGWTDVAQGIKLGGNLLLKHYAKLTEEMPFLRAKDVVEEMLEKIRNRQAKEHATAALESLGNFAKLQRQKIAMRVEKQRKKEQMEKEKAQTKEQEKDAANAPGLASSSASSRPGASAFNFSFGSGSTVLPRFTHAPIRSTGGLDDVD
ncbi:hypothetical protein Moror_6711 [Moniliophthora roreri MCA 2997]|uniref:Uncharacterized protein n=1 Tax=Moniliophthora roreri (strain MCA 2997) TaxID=1381753 RepID=V2YYC9_MONRO|nr:hypothetical protein Moror_6711 [Moniliophthora roreri MCA 2997]